MTLTRRAFLASAVAAPLRAAANRRWNVLFMAADDMNTGLGFYGHPMVKTPNLDALAGRGLRFDRAYCQFPLCCPSRASLLTGLRPDTTQVLANDVDFRSRHPNAVTLPQMFKNAGYTSIRTGKMFHMNVPRGVGTPQYQDPPSWSVDLSPQGLELKSEGERRSPTPDLPPGNSFEWIRTKDGQGQADFNVAEQALSMLEKYRKEPFFLAAGFVRPHVPFVAPSRFYDLYPLERIRLAQNAPGDPEQIPAIARAVQPERWGNARMDDRGQREALRGYLASTSFMDEQAGRVLRGLKQMGLDRNTIVVFWGDHGYHLGEHTRWAKMTLMEPAARVPLLIAVPGQKRGATKALVEFVDLYPTLAGLCGLTPPENLEGTSLEPLWKNPNRAWKKAAFTQLQVRNTKGRAIRTDRYRYIRWESGDATAEELYDHQSDPGEYRNLAAEPAAAAALAEHRQILQAGWKAARPA